MPDTHKSRSPLQAFWRWLHSQSSFCTCSDDDVERMAHDLGISNIELRQLAGKGPHSADLLLERMAAIKEEQVPEENDDDFLRDSAEQLAAKRARLAQLKELLTSTMLGAA